MYMYVYSHTVYERSEKMITEINTLLEDYANSKPAPGMHISYIEKITQLYEIYGKILEFLEDEQLTTAEQEKLLKSSYEKMKQIIE